MELCTRWEAVGVLGEQLVPALELTDAATVGAFVEGRDSVVSMRCKTFDSNGAPISTLDSFAWPLPRP